MFRTIIRKFLYPESYTSKVYIKTLKSKYHIDIGAHCKFFFPEQVHIDTSRPHCLHIGDYVKITRGATILCHDFSRSVVCSMRGYSNVGEAGLTWIGNNVFIGMNATILMGAYIGDNSIVGAGAVVIGKFPNNVVLAGNPAKIICSIEEYFQKRKKLEIEEAKLYARKWKEKYGHYPTIFEMTNAFTWLYVPHTKESLKKYKDLFRLNGVDKQLFDENFLNSEPLFVSFDDFLNACEKLD